jgi:ABC-type enterochelin transport system ATPase subunit
MDALRRILMVDKGHVDVKSLELLELDSTELSSKLSEFVKLSPIA